MQSLSHTASESGNGEIFKIVKKIPSEFCKDSLFSLITIHTDTDKIVMNTSTQGSHL